MTRTKWTLETARMMVIKHGYIPMFDEYKNNKQKLDVICECGRPTQKTLYHISIGAKCGHCKDPKIGDRFGSLTITKIVPSKNTGCSAWADCDCGNSVGPLCGHAYISGNNKSCGYCNIPKIGDRFNSLVVSEVRPSGSGGASCSCVCDCGGVWSGKAAYLKSGNTKSCGKCILPNVGDRFGFLTIIDVLPCITRGGRVKAVCDCGTEVGPIVITELIRKDNKARVSCGNCKKYRNGVQTSYKSLELHKLVEEILDSKCKHNYDIAGKNFDIVNLKHKIVVEYDEYYWHRVKQDTTKKELADTRLAIKNGYQILRIRASNDLPTKEQLAKVLTNHFRHGNKQHTITTPGWKRAKSC